jgi:hypothetical protein
MISTSARILTATALLLALAGCEQAEPTSYLIPKESREVAMPTPVDQAKRAPATANSAAPGGMRLLPGMKEAADQAGEVSYTVPEGWQEVPPSGIRKVNLKVTDENGSAELTVLVFPGAVGGWMANINRWRGQIGLAAATPEDVPAFTQSYTISKHRGLYVRLEGGAQSILGSMLPFHGATWFFKFQGSSGTVLANEAKMKAFLDTVAIEDTHH